MKSLASERKHAPQDQRQALAKQVASLRRQRKQEWLADVLSQARSGNYRAISYMRRRQSVGHVHSSYMLCAGGEQQAVADLKPSYASKYAEDQEGDNQLSMRMVAQHVGDVQAVPFSPDEAKLCLSAFKQGKSAGEDGIPYEFLQVVAQTSLLQSMVDGLNRVLQGIQPIPRPWMEGRLTFLPKVTKPKCPKVLAPTMGKCFTKLLLWRLKDGNAFPTIQAGQLCAQQGCQSLDGSLSMQRLLHVSNKWNLPLVACKLDISAAFDSLHHSGIARFFTTCRPMREAWFLQYIICHGAVHLSLGGQKRTQPLKKGIMQGSAYSADLFARVLDAHLHVLFCRWNSELAPTWLKDLHAIIYADDLMLLATSRAEMQLKLRQIREHLSLIGLHLAKVKCQLLVSPLVEIGPPVCFSDGTPVQEVESLVFLGVLIGFRVTAAQTLGRSLGRAMNSFWCFAGILRVGATPVRERLKLLTSFVSSRRRWMSAAARPTTALLRTLRIAHTNLLMVICNPATDRLAPITDDWVARRRAARMISQHCGQEPWHATFLKHFWRYWGHAGRNPNAWNPIVKVCRMYDARWLMPNPDAKHRRGNWTDITRDLQDVWDAARERGEPLFWDESNRGGMRCLIRPSSPRMSKAHYGTPISTQWICEAANFSLLTRRTNFFRLGIFLWKINMMEAFA